jgi:hypothetical protein
MAIAHSYLEGRVKVDGNEVMVQRCIELVGELQFPYISWDKRDYLFIIRTTS